MNNIFKIHFGILKPDGFPGPSLVMLTICVNAVNQELNTVGWWHVYKYSFSWNNVCVSPKSDQVSYSPNLFLISLHGSDCMVH